MRQPFRRTATVAFALCCFGPWQAVGWQLGSRPAEQWIETLSRPQRVQRLQIEEVITRLRLKPGDVLADIGAGSGAFSLPFARAVAPSGKLYAVEVDQGLVDHIRERADAEQVANVEAVLGEFTDPQLPARNIDLAFFHDVLHHVRDRAAYLQNLATYIHPEGRIAVIERGHHNHAGDDRHELKMTKEQVTEWMADAGFRPDEEHFLYDGGKWFVVFARR